MVNLQIPPKAQKNDGKSFVFEKYIFSLMDSIQTSFHTGEYFRRYFQITRKKFGFYFTKYQNSCIIKKIACKLCLYVHRRIAPEMEVNRQQFSLPETVRHACMPMTRAARNRGTGTTCNKLLRECPWCAAVSGWYRFLSRCHHSNGQLCGTEKRRDEIG